MKKLNMRISKIERFLLCCCLVLVIMFPVVNLVSKATLSNMNMEVEILKNNINTKKKKVASLNMKVDELRSIANLRSIIESEGLAYNGNSVKVIINR